MRRHKLSHPLAHQSHLKAVPGGLQSRVHQVLQVLPVVLLVQPATPSTTMLSRIRIMIFQTTKNI